MKQRYSLRSNAVKFRAMALVMMALVMGGKMAVGQDTWKPAGTTTATYILRSHGTTGNNFDVYQADGTTLVASNCTQINGRINLSPNVAITLIFENTQTILFNGQFDFNGANSSLTMRLGDISATTIAHSHDNPTLRIIGTSGYNNQNVAFFLRSSSSTDVDQRKLIIEGASPTGTENIGNFQYNWDNNFVIDGDGPTLTVVDSTTMPPKVKAEARNNSSTCSVKPYALFRIQQGTLHLTNVTVQYFSNSWTNSGMVQLFPGNATAGVNLKFEHCYFTHIGAKSSTGSPVLRMQGQGGTNANRNALVKNCEFEEIFGSYDLAIGQTTAIDNANGTIRTLGNNKTPLTIEGCHLKHNYGCPVRWHGCGSSEKMMVKNCLIEYNFTCLDANANGGGGLLLKGPAEIQNCTIQNNHTNGSGGGIYLSTYTDFNSGTYGLIPEHTILQLDPTTHIANNVASGNGGGVAIEPVLMSNTFYNSSYPNYAYLLSTNGYIYHNESGEPFTVKFVQNGATISGNTANGNGGGVFINRPKTTTFYETVCYLDKGEISSNHAVGNGGGVAIVTTSDYENPSSMPSFVHPQNVTVTISDEAATAEMLIKDNSAVNGGGVYLEAYPITYNNETSIVTTTVLDYSNVNHNTATTSGGGLYVQRGTVSILKNNDDGAHKPTITKNIASNGDGGGLYLVDGVVRIKGADIGGPNEADGNKALTGSGGGIYVNTGDVNINYWKRDDNVATSYVQQYESAPTQIKNNFAGANGGGIFTHNGIVRAVGKVENHVNQKIEISNNIAENGSGGGVFCQGSNVNTVYVKLDNVELVGNEVQGSSASQGDNIVSGCGGGIYLQQGKIEITKCDLQQNKAYVNGGGINNHEGNIEVSGCLIGGWDLANNVSLGNEAGTAYATKAGKGGGIYLRHGDITVTDCQRGAMTYESKISYNKAYYNGGGLNTHEGKVTVTGGHEDAKRIEITHNEATTGSGGGIFCRGTNLNTEYITLTHVDVTDNQTLGTGGQEDDENTMPGCGGGMYLQLGKIHITDVKLQNNHANYNGGGINNHSGEIDVDGCVIGGEADKGNSAGNSGGGIYTNAGNIDIEDYIDNSVYGSILHCETKITHNTAVENGGGIDTRSGIVWVNKNQRRDHQIEITHNTAKKGGGVYANQGKIYTYNAFIDNNTATENGGGLNNHSGDILIYGGSLSNNTAQTGHGGGAYTNVGDIDIWPFNPDNLGMTELSFNDGTKMFNNLALYNGGGVNNHTGRVDLRYATIQNNTATRGNGGGIFCEGPRTQATGFTIRLMASLLNQNKTRGADGTDEEPTGRGGGVYLKYGRIFSQGTDFTNNTANINGGAINNHEGNIRVYGCNLQGNTATEGDGGGIFAHQGNIFIGPCGMKGSSSITQNTANQNGGGIYNYEGDISINGDQILQNTATNGDGGGIYVKLGDINMVGGQIDNNTATNGKGGGIYMGGTVKGTGGQPDGNGFTISERVEHTPIVQIIDVELGKDANNAGKYTATIHYHVVDDGNQGQGGDNTADGITWSDGSAITDVTDDPNGDVPGCRRKTISNLDGGQTYSVKAFATYTVDASTTLRSESVVDFTTYSSSPLVIIGAGTNIGKTSAEVNAKVLYDGTDEGTTAITYRGICFSTGDDPAAATKVADPRNSEAPYFNHDFYTVELTGLTPGTTYNAWAYATNAASETGFVYSAAHTTFTTTANIPDVTTTSATAGNYNSESGKASATFVGTANQVGGSAITKYGFVWSTDDDPTIAHDPKKEFEGNPSGSFNFTVDTLRPGTTYHARAYATNAEGTNYGAAIEFITKDADNKPVVRSTRFSDVTQHTATITNLLVYKGGSDVNQYGICWNTTGSPTIDDEGKVVLTDPYITNNNTPFSCNMTGLTANTTYHVRAFASNNNGETYSYGNDYSFTTLSSNPPRVEVDVTTTATQANIQCKVFYNGDDVTQFYIKWGKGEAGQSGYEEHTENYSGTIPSGDFTHTFTITPGDKDTEYWVYAYAKNEIGEFTNRKVNFKSGYAKPTITVGPTFANITYNPVTGHHLVTATATVTKGDNNVKAYGFVFGSSQYPTLDRESQEDDSDIRHTQISGDFSDESIVFNHILGSRKLDGGADEPETSYDVNALYSNRLYYLRAYATSKVGTESAPLTDDDYTYYPEEGTGYTPIRFLTLPNVYNRDYGQITNNSAVLNAEITSKDQRHYLRKKGFIWSDDPDNDLEYSESNNTTQYVENINSGVALAQSINHVVTGLTTHETYYWRAFVINQDDNIAYTDKTSFTTKYGVFVNIVPNGTVSGAGFYDNGPITLTATNTDNYHFNHWINPNGNNSTSNTYTITTITGDSTFTAHFDSRIIFVAGEGGSVSGTSGGNSITSGSYFNYNTSITLTAAPNTNYQFVSWTDSEGNEVSYDATYTFNVSQAISLTANFVSNRGQGFTAPRPTGASRPRDIYPAPAREPWDWEDDFFFPTDTLRNGSRTEPVNIPQINTNSAKYGGGVYVEKNEDNPAKIVFAGGSTEANVGTINNNTASEAGGGVYINESASMQMKGHCHVNSNHVPAGKKGGGIYLDGTLLVGDKASDGLNAHALQVNLNWVGDETYSDATRNNVYLPLDPILTGDALHKMRVITLLSDISGKEGTQYYSKIGLSVDRGFREVIYSEHDELDRSQTTAKRWLEHLMPETGSLTLNSAIFEDSQKYYALHVTPSDDLFDEDYIYLWSCWTSIVTSNPNNDGSGTTHFSSSGSGSEEVWHIYTNKGLAWFSSLINGLNGVAANPSAKAFIENDLDMSAYFWVPLGSVSGSTGSGTEIAFTDGGSYTGEFNGQGHVISGLICTYMTGIFKYGLFGTVSGNSVVKNTFIDDYRFSTYKQKHEEPAGSGQFVEYNPPYSLGGIAAKTEGNAIISNCEARGQMKTPYCEAGSTYVGGLVGLMAAGTETETNEVHSSMAMPEISGIAQNVGGLVGKIAANNLLKNSFSNVKLGAITNTSDNPVNVGGLVGVNNGTVENCYSRLQNIYSSTNPAPNNFYWFAGGNTGSITYCYAPVRTDCSFSYVPTDATAATGHGTYTATQRVSGKYGFKHRDHQVSLVNSGNTYVPTGDGIDKQMMIALNNWVDEANTSTTPKYSTWTRTMASPINDDYPILEFNDFVSAGSVDSIYMLYAANVNSMLTSFNATNTEVHPTPSIFLYDANPNPISVSNNDDVMLAIDEEVGILQSVPLKARVGVTIKNDRAEGTDPNWHLFSSAINNVPMGIRYRTAEDQTQMNVNNEVGVDINGSPVTFNQSGTYKQVIVDGAYSNPAVDLHGEQQPYHLESVWSKRIYFDPPQIEWYQSDNAEQVLTYFPNKVGYFPTNTPYGTWRDVPSAEFFDLYAYSEEFYHWVNFKREGTVAGENAISDHWHMDRDEYGNHWRLNYGYRDENGSFTLGNEPTLLKGKGYLLDLSSESMLMADGTLNTGEVRTWVTNTPVGTYSPTGNGYDAPWRTINLIGNPYQSFLDFMEFAEENTTNNDDLNQIEYATRDDHSTTSRNGYIYYVYGQSQNHDEYMASRFIHPHQGFFVKVKGDGALKFKDAMRVAGKSTDPEINSPYRNQVNYPLVNLLCYDEDDNCDLTIIEVNRPKFGGGEKMKKLVSNKGMIYARLEDQDFQVLFTPMGINTVPVRFKAMEDGYFTLRWNTLHGDFSYLHLIDNITGMDIDCLRANEYKFEGKTTDFSSRFKLVFDCTGIEEPDDDASIGSAFAFQMGDELVVNGEGLLQMFDVQGRCLMETQAFGQQSSHSLPKVASGVYLLKLAGNKQVKVQKMVIK